MTTLQSFLIVYFLLLLLASLVIIGFYIITRGEKLRQPDGSYARRGKLLKDWSIFWEQTTGTRRLYYQGDELQNKHKWLNDCNSSLAMRLTVMQDQSSFKINGTIAPEEYSYLRDLLQCQVEIKDEYVFIYQDEPEYYFPEWLRFPLSQCPPCMASVYGSIIFWSMYVVIPLQFAWTLYPGIAAILFWIMFCISLSALNKLFFNIVGS